jgi:hypothetical protein
MPTGYTSDLYEGKNITFTEFALKCARGMGAAVMLRDHDFAVLPTPENVQSTNYAEQRLPEAQAALARCEALSLNDWRVETEQYNKDTRKARDEVIEKNERMRTAYTEMIAQVEAWEPPSEDHVPFKEFMLQQLNDSLKHDVDDNVEQWYKTRTVEEHREATLARLRREVEYYAEEAEKDRKRNEGRAKWVQQLYESLDVGVPL